MAVNHPDFAWVMGEKLKRLEMHLAALKTLIIGELDYFKLWILGSYPSEPLFRQSALDVFRRSRVLDIPIGWKP
jgi:hypothetical protein